MEHTVKILLNFLHDLRVVFQGQAEHAGHRLLGHVVIGGAQAAGEHQQVAAGPGSLHRRPQTLGVVPHGGVVQHVDPGRGQQLRQKLRVGVGNIAQKQLGAHGDDLRLMGHGITSFSLGCRGVLLEGKTPKRRPLAPPPGELSAQPTERGNANRWIIPFRSPYRPSQSPSVTALPEGEPSRGRRPRRAGAGERIAATSLRTGCAMTRQEDFQGQAAQRSLTTSRPSMARRTRPSTSRACSISRTSSTWGRVLGWRGVNTVQQSS